MRRRWVWLLLLVALAGLYLASGIGHELTLAAVQRHAADLQAWRAQQPLAAAALFFAAYVVMAALSLPGATVMTLAAGSLFGLGWGTLIVSFASSIGATLAFLSARWLLGTWVRTRFGPRLAAVDAGIAKDGGYYLFTLRLVPVLPFFVINLAAGLTSLRTATFYGVSQLGMLPATVLYVNAGTQLARIEAPSGIVSPAVLGSLALLGLLPLVARKALAALRARRIYARYARPARFDRNLVVIGGGSAGLVTAYIAAALKARVTLVEQHALGGDCLNTGCVPSKALIRSAAFLAQIGRAGELGIASAHAEFDFGAVMERVQRVVRAVEPHDSAARYTALGVDVALGRAHIVSPWEVEITKTDGRVERLTTRAIVIAAGARPYLPPIPGLDRVEVLTSDNVWNLRQRPERLVVLGGGPIGCELTQAFARLGSRVTQVEQLPRILAREDAEVSDLVAARFRAEGITVLSGHKALRVEIDGPEKRLVVEAEGRERAIAFDAILVAVGRAAQLQGYGLEELGVTTGRTVEVNGYLQTNFPNIYAAGDVAGPYQFTHMAAHQAWYAAVNALFDPLRKFSVDYRVVPWATFVEPEVARVGLNEIEAREKNVPHEVTVYELADLDRAIADGRTPGFVKVLTEPGRDRILGVTIVGEHAGDLIAEYVLAMTQGIGLKKILATIHIYPTLAEANKNAAGRWRQDHAPRALLAWVGRYHRWRRGGATVDKPRGAVAGTAQRPPAAKSSER
ncbi:MAG: FAD-dependent oxidoreductase [Burkholderiales bacterium]|nr:FAD-dependent oxidoreductase [Burkholderiales bacterium]